MTCPLVVVACNRDIPLLELQAQSIYKYLTPGTNIYIIVNELDTDRWYNEFAKFQHLYSKHKLTVIPASNFDILDSPKASTKYRKWAGWDTQQVLKLAIATVIEDENYLVVDCQNFLVSEFNPIDYVINGKSFYRISNMTMPKDTWQDYTSELGLSIDYPEMCMSICTPIFLNRSLVESLINRQGSLLGFSFWFNKVAKLKSEFMLYLLWAEENGGIDKHHFLINELQDWASPYLRDSQTFKKDFSSYLENLGKHKPHKWTSINFRAWGELSDSQYNQLVVKLQQFGLNPNFESFRAQYQLTLSSI